MNKNIVFKTDLKDITEDEKQKYLDFVAEHNNNSFDGISQIAVIKKEDNNVEIRWHKNEPKFERIRRITGYLTGTVDSWNDAKRAEEHDRLKHN